MSDPLSFFAGDDSSDSDSEEDLERGRSSPNTVTECSESTAGKLPSPSTLFATVGMPSFLKNPQEKHLNWDNFVKNEVETEQSNIHTDGDGTYAAIPPPSDPNMGQSKAVQSSLSTAIANTYNKDSASEISAPPVRYTNPDEVDPKYRVVSDMNSVGSTADEGSQKAGSKRTNQVEGGEDTGSKKLKTDTFRKKEKRKRDLGQSSRGKSYVEEEKRLLRQQFGTDAVMS